MSSRPLSPPTPVPVERSALLADLPGGEPEFQSLVRKRGPGALQRAVTGVLSRVQQLVAPDAGPFATGSWAASLLVHGVLMVALYFVILAPQLTMETPQLLGAMAEIEGPAPVDSIVGDLQPGVASELLAEPTSEALSAGGSRGLTRPDLSQVFGHAGFGAGVGSGLGDAIGNAISGRVSKAGGKGGRLQISVAWDDRNDLDLHVVMPDDERIFYGHPISRAGGVLDVDMNVRPETDEPVENITWMDRTPDDGRYRIQVHFFQHHRGQPSKTTFTVRLQMADVVKLFQGTITENRFSDVATFDVTEGRGGNIQGSLKEVDEKEAPVVASDAKRNENRERFARDALNEAKATGDVRQKTGMLRSVVKRFRGTAAATEAEKLLLQMGATVE